MTEYMRQCYCHNVTISKTTNSLGNYAVELDSYVKRQILKMNGYRILRLCLVLVFVIQTT